MNVELITKEDLQRFKVELLEEIMSLLPVQPTQMREPKKEWMKSKEFMKLIECTEGKLQRLRIRGEIEHKKIGGRYYYRLR